MTENYPNAAFFVRGDSNVNKNNKKRLILINQVIDNFSLKHVGIDHPTYHHFTGGGLYDSNIDVLLYSDQPGISEDVTRILCKKDFPDMLSHHDMIMSECTIPATLPSVVCSDDLLVAPRITNSREKFVWCPEGVIKYEELITPALKSLRETWLDPGCTASMSVLFQMTNHVLTFTARSTNKSVSLAAKPSNKPKHTPKVICIAGKKLGRANRNMRNTHRKTNSQEDELGTAQPQLVFPFLGIM